MKGTPQKKGNLLVTIIGILIFAGVYFLTAFANIQIRNNPETASPLRNMIGVFSQLQVLGVIIMVVFDRKRGYIIGMLLQCLSAIQVIIVQILIIHNMSALPGAVTGAVSMIIYTIIYTNIEKNLKLHDELTVNYEQLIEQNRLIEEKDKTLTYLAYYDRMTGLPNRAFFSDKIQEYIDSATPFAVIYMDADNFKQINDNFGHQIGDELIKIYADRFEKYCGTKYTCAKVGGDEFGMILVGKYTEADIMNIVEQLRTLFGEPVNVGSGQFSITMSYGICGFPNDGSNPDALIVAADTALYNAKIGGKNRPCFFSQHSLG